MLLEVSARTRSFLLVLVCSTELIDGWRNSTRRNASTRKRSAPKRTRPTRLRSDCRA
jgi:hypothetical protein